MKPASILLACATLAVCAAPAFAQIQVSGGGGSQGIVVSGSGEAIAKPTAVEFDLSISGNAEIFGDALVKFRDSKRRTLEALNALGLKDLSIEERGLSLARGDAAEIQNRAMRGDTGANIKPKIEVLTRLRVKLGSIGDVPAEQVLETVGKLIDTARDAGNDIGPTTAEINMSWRYGRQINGALARFVLEDFDKSREQAYQAAIDDARNRAERLARLTGVQLGPVESISELAVAGDDHSANNNVIYFNTYGMQNQEEPNKAKARITSDTLTEIPVRVRLQVRYGISGSAEKAVTQN